MNDSLFIAGLDLGQVNDPTALAILERPRIHNLSDPPPVYAARFLHRFPLGSSYPAIVAGLQEILTHPELNQCEVFLAVDKTGVGAPICDMVRPIFPHLAAISITAGEQASAGPTGFCVPKRLLAATVQQLLQTRRLLVAQSLPQAQQLKSELQNFKVKINLATGNESFEAWREKDHDDLVLAVAMAAWLGEQIAIAEREAAEEAAEMQLMQYAQARARPGDTVLRHFYS
jgi:hypothetical protein